MSEGRGGTEQSQADNTVCWCVPNVVPAFCPLLLSLTCIGGGGRVPGVWDGEEGLMEWCGQE